MNLSDTNPQTIIKEFDRLQKESQNFHEFPMTNLLNAWCNKNFESFQQLVDALGSGGGGGGGDVSRKRTFLNWIVDRRNQTVKVLTILRYLRYTHSKLYMCDGDHKAINKYLSVQEQYFTSAADGLYFMHQTLGNITQPVYDISNALDVLLTGTYPSIPRCLNFTKVNNIDNHLPDDKQVEYEIASRLLFQRIPKSVQIRIAEGKMEMGEEGVWTVELTLRAKFEPEFEWVWIVLNAKICIRLKNRPNDDPVHPQQLQRMKSQLQAAMLDSSDDVIMKIYKIMHEICADLAIEMIYAETLRFFPADDLSKGDDTLTIRYWHNLPKSSPDSQNIIKIGKSPDGNYIEAAQEQLGDFIVEIPLGVDMSVSDALEKIYSEHAKQFLERMKNALSQFDSRVEFIPDANHYRLIIVLFPWLSVAVSVQKKTGVLLVTDFNSHQGQFAEAQEALQTTPLDEIPSLFQKLALDCLSDLLKSHSTMTGIVSSPLTSDQGEIRFQFPSMQSWNILIKISLQTIQIMIVELLVEIKDGVQLKTEKSPPQELSQISAQIPVSDLFFQLESVIASSWNRIYETALVAQMSLLNLKFSRIKPLRFQIDRRSLPSRLNYRIFSDLMMVMDHSAGKTPTVLFYCRCMIRQRPQILLCQSRKITDCVSQFLSSIYGHLRLSSIQQSLKESLHMFPAASVAFDQDILRLEMENLVLNFTWETVRSTRGHVKLWVDRLCAKRRLYADLDLGPMQKQRILLARFLCQLETVNNYIHKQSELSPIDYFSPIPFYDGHFRIILFQNHAIDIFIRPDVVHICDVSSPTVTTVLGDKPPAFMTHQKSPSASSYLNEETPAVLSDQSHDNSKPFPFKPIPSTTQLFSMLKQRLKSLSNNFHTKNCSRFILVSVTTPSTGLAIVCEHPWSVEFAIAQIYKWLQAYKWFEFMNQVLTQHKVLRHRIDLDKLVLSVSNNQLACVIGFNTEQLEWKVQLSSTSAHQRLLPDEASKLTLFIIEELTAMKSIEGVCETLTRICAEPKDFVKAISS